MNYARKLCFIKALCLAVYAMLFANQELSMIMGLLAAVEIMVGIVPLDKLDEK